MTDVSVASAEKTTPSEPISEEERRRKLQELVNVNCCPMFIYPADESTESLIFVLWARRVKVPSELTFGEPYDTAFVSFSNRHFHTLVSHFLFSLWSRQEQLTMFLSYAIEARHSDVNLDQMDQIRTQIWNKLPVLSSYGRFVCISDLQSAFRNQPLSQLDLTYVAVMLDELGILSGDFGLWNFVRACNRVGK